MFGFTVYSSIWDAEDGKIPYPSKKYDHVDGGHAVVAAGYDDDVEIAHPTTGEVTQGAFLIRNSWGRDWGEKGYGWLPYDYVTHGLADDWWSLMKNEWVDTGEFKA